MVVVMPGREGHWGGVQACPSPDCVRRQERIAEARDGCAHAATEPRYGGVVLRLHQNQVLAAETRRILGCWHATSGIYVTVN